jgi:hypothetical protein
MSTDYSLFYRRAVDVDNIQGDLDEFDVYISAFNSSQRVAEVFSAVRAKKKIWLIHPEYAYSDVEIPKGAIVVRPGDTNEISQTNALLHEVGETDGLKICVDITGIMRHVLVFLIASLRMRKVKKITALYSEPDAYSKQEDTVFSTATGAARIINGMGGKKIQKADEILILAVGYDYKLINEVTSDRDYMPVYPIFGFPSLSPDMYQQSAIKSSESGSATFASSWVGNRRFAPANDPFTTAEVVAEIVAERERSNQATNIYLSPLSTKAQALGFALFWLYEQNSRRSIAMLLPTLETYSRETSTGLKRLWEYIVELDFNDPIPN